MNSNRQAAPPPGITVENTDRGLTLTVARRSPVDYVVLAFGLLLVLIGGSMLAMLLADRPAFGLPLALFTAMLLGITALGGYTLYLGLAQLINRKVIHVSWKGLVVRSAPLPLPGEKPVRVSAVKRVALEAEKAVIYHKFQAREVDLYRLEILSWDRKVVPLIDGAGSAEDVRFIARQIEHWLGLMR